MTSETRVASRRRLESQNDPGVTIYCGKLLFVCEVKFLNHELQKKKTRAYILVRAFRKKFT